MNILISIINLSFFRKIFNLHIVNVLTCEYPIKYLIIIEWMYIITQMYYRVDMKLTFIAPWWAVFVTVLNSIELKL